MQMIVPVLLIRLYQVSMTFYRWMHDLIIVEVSLKNLFVQIIGRNILCSYKSNTRAHVSAVETAHHFFVKTLAACAKSRERDKSFIVKMISLSQLIRK